MERIERRELRDHIFISLKCAPKLARKVLKTTLSDDWAIGEIADKICDYLDNDYRGVFQVEQGEGFSEMLPRANTPYLD